MADTHQLGHRSPRAQLTLDWQQKAALRGPVSETGTTAPRPLRHAQKSLRQASAEHPLAATWEDPARSLGVPGRGAASGDLPATLDPPVAGVSLVPQAE